jgi:Ser/Thr protein kinase RdoA (MazF antagonist)
MSGEYGAAVLADLEQMARSALPAYGCSRDAGLKLLNVSENATYRVDADHGRMILRLHRVGYHSEVAIQSELAWIDALRSDGIVETAAPLADQTGRRVQTLTSAAGHPPRHAVMFSFLEGAEPSPDDALEPWFFRLGATTAKLHAHAMRWQKPQGFTRHIWDLGAMFGSQNLWGPWQAGMGLTADGEVILSKAIDAIETRMRVYGQGADRFGLVHADLRLANLLVDGEGLKVIDFDDCGFSWFMYDFAAAVSFFEERPSIPGLMERWFEGYSTIRALSAEDRAIMPTLVLARRILLTAWLASHSEVPIAQELGADYTQTTVALAEAYLLDRFLM